MYGTNEDKPKILHVDDDALQQLLIAHMLTKQGFDVKSASDGQKGFALATAWIPDLILMDVMMPIMDGIQATAALRSHTHTANIPILALTSSTDEETRSHLTNVGINEILAKTISADTLVERLYAYLKNGHR